MMHGGHEHAWFEQAGAGAGAVDGPASRQRWLRLVACLDDEVHACVSVCALAGVGGRGGGEAVIIIRHCPSPQLPRHIGRCGQRRAACLSSLQSVLDCKGASVSEARWLSARSSIPRGESGGACVRGTWMSQRMCSATGTLPATSRLRPVTRTLEVSKFGRMGCGPGLAPATSVLALELASVRATSKLVALRMPRKPARQGLLLQLVARAMRHHLLLTFHGRAGGLSAGVPRLDFWDAPFVCCCEVCGRAARVLSGAAVVGGVLGVGTYVVELATPRQPKSKAQGRHTATRGPARPGEGPGHVLEGWAALQARAGKLKLAFWD